MYQPVVRHYIDVADLERSVHFYEEVLGFRVVERYEAGEGLFEGCLLKGHEGLEIEMTYDCTRTWRLDRNLREPYMSLKTYNHQQSYGVHDQLGCVVSENNLVGVYFIKDPDGYLIEMIPHDQYQKEAAQII